HPVVRGVRERAVLVPSGRRGRNPCAGRAHGGTLDGSPEADRDLRQSLSFGRVSARPEGRVHNKCETVWMPLPGSTRWIPEKKNEPSSASCRSSSREKGQPSS